jgi:hypothetical protein
MTLPLLIPKATANAIDGSPAAYRTKIWAMTSGFSR